MVEADDSVGGEYRGTLAGDGRPGPIEHRMGRRLMRLIEPESDEGQFLLSTGRVEIIGPDGRSLGHVPANEAYDLLLARLDDALDKTSERDRRTLRECRKSIRSWSERIDQAPD